MSVFLLAAIIGFVGMAGIFILASLLRAFVPAAARHRAERPAARLKCIVALCLAAGAASMQPQAQGQEISEIITEQNQVIERFRPPLELQRRIALAVPLEVRALVHLPEQEYPLRRVEIVGATYLAPEALSVLWAPLLGQPVGRARIEELVLAIERFYLEADVYARALVTAWEPDSGVLKIEVFEGYLHEIIVDSALPDMAERLRPYTRRMAALVPLRVSLLERELLLIADLAGITIDAHLEQIPERIGAGRLTLTIGPIGPAVVTQLDNLASPDNGPWKLTGIGVAGDLMGHFEQSTLVGVVNPVAPREFLFGQASQEVPLGTRGLRFGYSLGHVRSEPGGEARLQNLRIDSDLGHLWIQYPFLRRIQHNLIGRLELSTQDDEVRAGSVQVVDDRKRWLTLSGTYDRTFDTGSLLARLGFSQGLEALNASGADSRKSVRFGGRPDFRLISGELQLRKQLAEGWTLSGAITGQLALNRLPAAVRLSVGDERFGRAFAGTAVSGDSGIAGAIELRHDLGASTPELAGLAAFAFADYGYLHNDPLGVDFRSARLGSLGLGLSYKGMVKAVVTTPVLSSRHVDDRGTRLFVTLSHAF